MYYKICILFLCMFVCVSPVMSFDVNSLSLLEKEIRTGVLYVEDVEEVPYHNIFVIRNDMEFLAEHYKPSLDNNLYKYNASPIYDVIITFGYTNEIDKWTRENEIHIYQIKHLNYIWTNPIEYTYINFE